MTRAPAAIATLCALLLPQSQALHVSNVENTTQRDLSCVCKDWAEVYKKKEITCGQGMELYFLLSGKTNVSSNVRNKLALAKHHQGASLLLKDLMNTSVYQQICTNFFMRSNFNYCVHKRYMPSEIQWKLSKGSWCYVSHKCKIDQVEPIEGTKLSAKKCSPHFDVSLGFMPLDMAAKLARTQNLDQAVFAGHAYIFMDKLVSEITNDELKELKKSDKDHYIWSPRNFYAPRWVVRQREVWEHRFNNNTKNWDARCTQGCIY